MSGILVVVDCQEDFLTGALGSPEAKAIIGNVVEKCIEFGSDAMNAGIFVTLDTHDESYLSTQEGKKLPVVHCRKMTKGWMLHSDIMWALGKSYVPYRFIEKSTFGSEWLVTKIAEVVQKKDVDKIELVGVCTDICVISNAVLLKTAFPEIEIVVDASCCAGVTPEKHAAALEVMKSLQITVIGESYD